MRTTLSVDDDLLRRLQDEAKRTKTPFRSVLNRALRTGVERLHPESARPRYQAPTFSMGFPPRENMDKALQLAAMLEDEETARKLSQRK